MNKQENKIVRQTAIKGMPLLSTVHSIRSEASRLFTLARHTNLEKLIFVHRQMACGRLVFISHSIWLETAMAETICSASSVVSSSLHKMWMLHYWFNYNSCPLSIFYRVLHRYEWIRHLWSIIKLAFIWDLPQNGFTFTIR